MARRYPPNDVKRRPNGPRVQAINEDDDDSLPFTRQDPFSDVALVVGGRKLYTARSLLAYNSPVLEKTLSHGKKQDLDLPKKEYDDMVEFLSYIDPRVPYTITDIKARQLLPLAEEYEMARLKRSCGEVLTESYKALRKEYGTVGSIPPEINQVYLQLSDKHHFEPLLRMCIDEYVSSPEVHNTHSLVEAGGVSDAVKLMILDRKLARLNRELEKERRYRSNAEHQLDSVSPRKLWRNK